MSKFAHRGRFMPPEFIRDEDYNKAGDIWGIGVLLYFMATFTYPFPETENMEKLEAAFKNKEHLAALEGKFSTSFVQLVEGLLEEEVNKRWTIENVIE